MISRLRRHTFAGHRLSASTSGIIQQVLRPVCKVTVMVLMAILTFVPESESGVTSIAIAKTDTQELEQVRGLFNDGLVLEAVMHHEFSDAYTGEVQQVQGRIWLSSEKYLVKTDHQSVLVDGRYSMVFNSRQLQVVISDYEPEEDDFAPSRFLSGQSTGFSVASRESSENRVILTMVPDDPFELFVEVVIVLDSELRPLEIRALDQMENRFTTLFTESAYRADAEGLFELNWPSDAEIIDLRR
jgi:hypothetical protein